MVSILYPGMPQGPDFSGFADGLAGLGQMLDNRRANKAYAQYDEWLRGISEPQQAQQQPMSLASLGQQGGQVDRAPLPPVQDVASQRVAQAHAASGGTPPQGAIEAYIRHAAKQRGIDPETAVRVAMSEGGVSDPTRQSDVVKNGVREQSYGPFQLYMGGGLGNEFQQATGLHPSDPGAWQKGIDFALDKAKEGGWGPWYGAAKAGIGDRDGIGGAPAALNAMSGQSGQQMPQGAPQGNSGSLLPPADVMKALFKSEQTRPLAIQLAQSAQKARMGDPMAQLELEKARLEVEKLRNPSMSDRFKSVDNKIFDTTNQSWIEPPNSGIPETGLTPQLMQDENGNMIYVQPTKDGRLVQSKGPEGYRPVSPFDKSFQTTLGKSEAENAATFQQSEGKAQQILATLDSLENHPGMSSAVGWQGAIPDAMIPAGTDMAGFKSVLDQVQGQAFLQAFESLKGGGQITEIEGQKATAAITRLNRSLSEAEFKKAIDELRDVVKTGMSRAQKGEVVDPAGNTVYRRQSQPQGSRTSSGVQWSIEE